MDTLIPDILQDTLDYLREVAQLTPFVFATQEEVDYFTPQQKPYTESDSKKENLNSILPVEEAAHLIPKPNPSLIFEKKHHHEIRQTIGKIFPEWSLRESPLDDGQAKKMARLWEETYLSAQIVILTFGERGAHLDFLKNMTGAIDKLIAPAQLIDGFSLEKEQGWEFLLNTPTLKSIIAPPLTSWKSTSLSKYYKQNGTTQQQFLGSHPLLLLEPILVYLKHPQQKRKLWQLINTQLLS